MGNSMTEDWIVTEEELKSIQDKCIVPIILNKKELNIIKYLASLKVDSPQYADVNQELTTILKKIAEALDF
jgi:invasion protein IalB